jgi:ABC-type multidrug transport system ATPase subunit
VLERFPILAERINQAAGTLSGGEQQMLVIGRALMSRPQLMLLDEPSLGLAPLIAARIFEIIVALNGQGVAVLLVEQNARAALKLAKRGYVIELGRTVLEGENLSENKRVLEAHRRALNAANRNIGVAFMSPLVSEDGVCVPDAVQHDAPHALLQPARTVSARRGAPLIRDLRRVCVLLW